MNFLFCQHTNAAQAAFYRIIMKKYLFKIAQIRNNAVQHRKYLFHIIRGDVAAHAANLNDRKNDASTGGHFKNIEHTLAQTPALHKDVYKRQEQLFHRFMERLDIALNLVVDP